MLMCWAENPEDRPSFFVLSGMFGTILGNQNVRNVKLIFLYETQSGPKLER